MARNVFIFGAGASRDAGGPLIRDFLDKARQFADPTAYERVRNGIKALRQTYPTAMLDLLNIENLATAFEMAAQLQHLPGLKPDEIDALPAALRQVIVTTVGRSIERGCIARAYMGLFGPETYAAFYQRVIINLQSSALISFNYDVGLDMAVVFPTYERFDDKNLRDLRPNKVEYCLEADAEPERRDAILLKPHGSLNWAFCEACRKIIPWQPLDFVASVQVDYGRFMTVGERIHELQHCSQPVSPAPVIVPPLWGKGSPEPGVAHV